jgi:hypothetical protein
MCDAFIVRLSNRYSSSVAESTMMNRRLAAMLKISIWLALWLAWVAWTILLSGNFLAVLWSAIIPGIASIVLFFFGAI